MSVMWCIFIASCCEHYPDIIPMFLGHEAWAAASCAMVLSRHPWHAPNTGLLLENIGNKHLL